MRHPIAAMLALGLALAAQAYPVVSSDPNNVQLNVWNTNLSQAKAKAKALNRPALMVMLDSDNCGFSKAWITNIADSQEWQTFLAANPLVLIMADKPKLSLNTWLNYTAPFRDSKGTILFPTVVLFRPDGSVADQILARGTLGVSPGFYDRVKTTTDQYSGSTPPVTTAPGTVGFAVSSAAVSEGAATVAVTVKRQGGTSGSQTFSYATANGTAYAGVNFTGKSGALSWADGDASDRTVSVALINDNTWKSPTARTFTIRLARTSGTATLGTSALTVTINEVSPNPTSVAPAFTAPTPGAGSTVSAILNSAASIQVAATGSATISYSATGLPAGLSINSGTGLISGKPTIAGSSIVTVTASNSKGAARISFTLRVASQSTAMAGSYKGMLYDPTLQTVRGTLTLAASAYGTLRAQVVLDGISYSSYTGTWETGTANTAELHALGSSEALSIQVDALGILTGTLGEAALLGRRVDTSSKAEFAGYYTALLGAATVTPNSSRVDNEPAGFGYVTFTVGSSGLVSYRGVLADGALFSGSSTILRYSGTELAGLGYTGLADDQSYAFFPICNALYARRGTVAAQIWIDGDQLATQSDNKVFVVGSEWFYPGRSTTYDADGFTACFDDGLFTEIGAAFVVPENLADTFDGASFQVDSGAVPVQASLLQSINLPSGNSLKATLTASRLTGLFTGSFLYTPESGTPYTVRYSGVLVPALGLGGGYYLTPDTSVTAYYGFKRSRSVMIAP